MRICATPRRWRTSARRSVSSQALYRAHPIGLRAIVPVRPCGRRTATTRARTRRSPIATRRARVRARAPGRVALDGGWRVYSSGAGILIGMVLRSLLGHRLASRRDGGRPGRADRARRAAGRARDRRPAVRDAPARRRRRLRRRRDHAERPLRCRSRRKSTPIAAAPRAWRWRRWR